MLYQSDRVLEPEVHAGFQGPGPVHMGSEGPVEAGVGVGILPHPGSEAHAGIVPAAIIVASHIHAPGPVPGTDILVSQEFMEKVPGDIEAGPVADIPSQPEAQPADQTVRAGQMHLGILAGPIGGTAQVSILELACGSMNQSEARGFFRPYSKLRDQ